MKFNRSSLLYATVVVLTAYAGASAMQATKGKSTPPQPDAQPKHDHDHDHGHEDGPELPGAEHKQLAKHVGNWTYSTKMSMTAANDAPPMESTGTAKISSVLGGRFILEENSSTMMGQPVEGRHYTGYNSQTKQYEANWTWTMNNSMMNMTGTSSDGGKTIISDAMVQEHGSQMKLKVTTKYIDDDHFSVELRSDGPEGGTMMTQYTRKK